MLPVSFNFHPRGGQDTCLGGIVAHSLPLKRILPVHFAWLEGDPARVLGDDSDHPVVVVVLDVLLVVRVVQNSEIFRNLLFISLLLGVLPSCKHFFIVEILFLVFSRVQHLFGDNLTFNVGSEVSGGSALRPAFVARKIIFRHLDATFLLLFVEIFLAHPSSHMGVIYTNLVHLLISALGHGVQVLGRVVKFFFEGFVVDGFHVDFFISSRVSLSDVCCKRLIEIRFKIPTGIAGLGFWVLEASRPLGYLPLAKN
jgi:hypothetical protein